MERNDAATYAEEYDTCLQDALESVGVSDLAVPEIDKVDFFPINQSDTPSAHLHLTRRQELFADDLIKIRRAQHKATEYDWSRPIC